MTVGNVWLGSMQLQQISQAQNLSTNSFNMNSVVMSVPSVLDRVCIHASSGPVSENFYVNVIPAAGTTYCTMIYQTAALNASATSGNIFYQPNRPLFMYPGDQVNIRVSNATLSSIVIYGNMNILY